MLDDPQKSYRPTPEKLRALWDIAMRLIAMREDFGRRIDMLDKKNSNILSKLASLPGGEIPGVPPGGPTEPPYEPPYEPPPPPPPPPGEPPIIVEPAEQCEVVIHAHNPEGIEIGSITNLMIPSCSVGSCARTLSEHFLPHSISSGIHAVSASFNRITINYGNVNFLPNTRTIITFTWPRTTQIVTFNHVGSGNYVGDGTSGGDSFRTPPPPSIPFGYMVIENCGWGWIRRSIGNANYTLTNSAFNANVNWTCNYEFVGGGGITYDSNSGGMSIVTRDMWFPFEIPIQQFDSWFIRSKGTGNYPLIVLRETGTPGSTAITNMGGYRTNLMISALVSYDAIKFNLSTINAWAEMNPWTLEMGSMSTSVSATMENLVLLSIPFDIDNVGF